MSLFLLQEGRDKLRFLILPWLSFVALGIRGLEHSQPSNSVWSLMTSCFLFAFAFFVNVHLFYAELFVLWMKIRSRDLDTHK